MSSDRFSGRVEPPSAKPQVNSYERSANANDSVSKKQRATPTPVKRISAARVRNVEVSLTDVDRSVIQAMGIIRIATGNQLRRLHWPDTDTGRRMARHHLAKLVELRVLARLDRRIGGVRAGSEGFTYTLDVIGQRLVDGHDDPRRRRRPRTPGPSFIDHELAVSEAYVVLTELDRTGGVHLERFDAEPACWRTYAGPNSEQLVLKPDAFAITDTTEFEDAWFLEIDRGTEHPGRITGKAKDYCDYAQALTAHSSTYVMPVVLFIVPGERRAQQLSAAIARLATERWQLFQICTAEQFAAVITAGPCTAAGQDNPTAEGGEP